MMDATYLIDRPFRAICLLAKFGASIGLGHAMRSLAFCASIRKRYPELPIVWFSNGNDNEAYALADTAGISTGLTVFSFDSPLETISGEGLKAHFKSLKLPLSEVLMVVDVYEVPQESWRDWLRSGASIFAIDDFARSSVIAHGILNHGTDLQSLYADWHKGLLALGASYALLREPFASFPASKSKEMPQIFISLGGSSMIQVLKPMLQVLLVAPALKDYSFVIVSKQALDFSELGLQEFDDDRINILVDPSPQAMLETIDSAALCITSASTTAYEVCARYKPLVVIETVDNQRQLCQYLEKSGLAYCLSLSDLTNAVRVHEVLELTLEPKNQALMLEAQSRLFDGQQAGRHADFADAVWKRGQTLHIRKADAHDTELTFNWANDPETRAAAFTQEPILWQTHEAYFQAKLVDNQYYWYIGSRNTAESLTPVGQVRFAWTHLEESYQSNDKQALIGAGTHCWTISYLVAPEWRGQRLAAPILAAAIQQLRAEGRIEPLLALVKLSNGPSLRAFESLGFVDVTPISNASALRDEGPAGEGIRHFWLKT